MSDVCEWCESDTPPINDDGTLPRDLCGDCRVEGERDTLERSLRRIANQLEFHAQEARLSMQYEAANVLMALAHEARRGLWNVGRPMG